jgi:hypothetical protein
MKTGKWLLVVTAVLLSGGVVLGVMTGALIIKSVEMQTVRALLQTMFVVALFIERSLEVFISAWRDPEAAPLKVEKDAATRDLKLAVAANQGISGARTAATQAEKDLEKYKAETKRIALIAALTVGVLVSASGLRSFETFLNLRTQHHDGWERAAGALFNAVNVLITGGLLGGGSELIHKILKVITDFLDQTSGRLQKASQ